MSGKNEKYQSLGWGITRIETGFHRPNMAACYLLQHRDKVVVIETGTIHTVDTILALLRASDIKKEQVAYVIPTHVHLDHAGGAGALMRELPDAQLVVHPRGARHMIDPARLQAGATAVYGEAVYRKMYGELVPVAEDRVIEAGDGFTLDVAGRSLLFLDTPGHARHHFCIYDAQSEGIFSGDTFGIAYPEFTNEKGPFIFPTSTPVQFDPQAMKTSIQRLMELHPQRFYLTHYGMVENPQSLADSLIKQVDDYVLIARRCADDENIQQSIFAALMNYTLERLRVHGCDLDAERCMELLKPDMTLNAQGLEIWLTQQAENSAVRGG
jgi:glyoxylase-like metal-dependent hydrolase (beta-lactamase superfamily II)